MSDEIIKNIKKIERESYQNLTHTYNIHRIDDDDEEEINTNRLRLSYRS